MRLRSLLASAALAATMGIGSLAMMAGPASAASTNGQPECWSQQCNQPPKCNDFNFKGNGDSQDCGICHQVVTTPWEPNLTYVTNTTGETVTVTLGGNYYWVQTKSPLRYYGPWTKTVVLLPGQSISVAWHNHTGDHWWIWSGPERCIPAPQPCVTGHDTWNQQDNRCDPRPVSCVTSPFGQGGNFSLDSRDIQPGCAPCLPVYHPETHITIPCAPKGHDDGNKDGKGSGAGGPLLLHIA